MLSWGLGWAWQYSMDKIACILLIMWIEYYTLNFIHIIAYILFYTLYTVNSFWLFFPKRDIFDGKCICTRCLRPVPISPVKKPCTKIPLKFEKNEINSQKSVNRRRTFENVVEREENIAADENNELKLRRKWYISDGSVYSLLTAPP